MYELETSQAERIEMDKAEFRRLGLYIFESFEEYMQDREEYGE